MVLFLRSPAIAIAQLFTYNRWRSLAIECDRLRSSAIMWTRLYSRFSGILAVFSHHSSWSVQFTQSSSMYKVSLNSKRAFSRNMRLKFLVIQTKQNKFIWPSCCNLYLTSSWSIRLELLLSLHLRVSFTEKLTEITLFYSEKHDFQWRCVF